MTSIKRQKNGRPNEKLLGGGWLSCFGRSVKYGGTVYTFREEEIAELHELPKKNSTRGHGHMFVSSKGNQQK